MKKLLMLLATTLFSISLFAETLAVTKANYFFSNKKVDLIKALKYVATKDDKGFDELLVSLQKTQTGGVTKAGVKVILLESDKGIVHFKVKGVEADFWTIQEALEIQK